jgi:hypothetical protein
LSESDAFARSSKERLLPQEALGEGGNEAQFNEQTDNGFYRRKQSHVTLISELPTKEKTASVKCGDTKDNCSSPKMKRLWLLPLDGKY